MLFRFLFSALLVQAFSVALPGQHDYQPGTYTKAIPPELLRAHEARMDRELLPYRREKVERNYREAAYAERLERLQLQFEAGIFLEASPLQDYVQQVFDRIVAANTINCTYPLRIQIESSGTVNALNYGNGIISIHLGLLQRLEREDQLAFVLAHELAHAHLDHFEAALALRLREHTDQTLQQQIKAIRRQTYNRYAQATALSRQFHYEYRASRREYELAADALGVTYLTQAGYDAAAAAEVLAILDGADRPIDSSRLDLTAIFHHAEFPFKARWLYSDDVELMAADYQQEREFDRDSMRTHPDIPLRLNTLGASPTGRAPDTVFQLGVQRTAALELVYALYHHGQYAQSLYRALLLLRHYPDSGYLHGMVGLNLGGIHLLRTERRYVDQVPLASMASTPNFQQLLRMLENLRLQELAQLTHYYLLPKEARFASDETFLLALIEATYLTADEMRRTVYEQRYNELYPNGRLFTR